jgi:EpsI family protein
MSARDRRPALITVAILLTALAAWYLTPRMPATTGAVALAQLVPQRFGEWRELGTSAAVDPRVQRPGETDPEAPYDDVLTRSYVNARGEVVMLALAYGRNQRQEIKIHRPELCYISQGFAVLRRSDASIPIAGLEPVNGARMLVRGGGRSEAVSYWIRIGDVFSRSAWKTRAHIFTEGLQGRVVDGMLVRVSQIVPDAASTDGSRFALQEQFLSDLVRAVPVSARRLFIGGAST